MKTGFTIIELMIVIAIMGLLMTIVLPNFIRDRNVVREKLCLNNRRIIGHAIEQYMTNSGIADVESLTIDIAIDYVKGGIPECPSNPADDNDDYSIGPGTSGGVLVTCEVDPTHTPPYDTGAP